MPGQHRGERRLRCFIGRHAVQCAQALAGHLRGDLRSRAPPCTQKLADDPVELRRLQPRHHGLERLVQRCALLRGGLERLRPGLRQELAPGTFVQYGEARRHVRLERKPLKQTLTEGVDGLHLEAARRLERPGEQTPRPDQAIGFDHTPPRDVLDAVDQILVAERNPRPEGVEDPVRHLRRCRLGEGEA